MGRLLCRTLKNTSEIYKTGLNHLKDLFDAAPAERPVL
jgi:hypothetical protein